MKLIGSILLALLFGLVLGGWGPRRDLKEAQRVIEELKDQVKKGGGRTTGFENIVSLLQVPDRAERRTRGTSPAGMASPPPGGTPSAAVSNQPGPGVRANGTNGAARVAFRERIKTAAEVWKMRRDLARNSFMSRVKPTPAEAAQVDVIMQAMNVRLEEGVARWVEYFKEVEEISPEDGVRMMNELSGVIVTTYDDLDRTLAEGWRDQAGEKFQVFDFINPEVAMPLADVEGIMDRPGRGGFQPPSAPVP